MGTECKYNKCSRCGLKHNSQSWMCGACSTAVIDMLEAENKELKETSQSFGNVLAVIHKDGGHYISKHGHRKASEDAIKILLEGDKQ